MQTVEKNQHSTQSKNFVQYKCHKFTIIYKRQRQPTTSVSLWCVCVLYPMSPKCQAAASSKRKSCMCNINQKVSQWAHQRSLSVLAACQICPRFFIPYTIHATYRSIFVINATQSRTCFELIRSGTSVSRRSVAVCCVSVFVADDDDGDAKTMTTTSTTLHSRRVLATRTR